MQLSALVPEYRRRAVLLALDIVLQDLSGPTGTREVSERIAKRLESREVKLIGRIIVIASRRIPEAGKGETYRQWGRVMQRIVWYPKGTLPEGGQTRAAKREGRTFPDRSAFLAYCVEHGLDPETGAAFQPGTVIAAPPEDETWSA